VKRAKRPYKKVRSYRSILENKNWWRSFKRQKTCFEILVVIYTSISNIIHDVEILCIGTLCKKMVMVISWRLRNSIRGFKNGLVSWIWLIFKIINGCGRNILNLGVCIDRYVISTIVRICSVIFRVRGYRLRKLFKNIHHSLFRGYSILKILLISKINDFYIFLFIIYG
jgi:hypothetical protein